MANAQQWSAPMVPDTEDSYILRMGILGYGSIGRQCARLASAPGMEVYAYTHGERATTESRREDAKQRSSISGTGDLDGILPAKWFHGSSQDSVNDFLGQGLDVLVISLPLTPGTQKLISSGQFSILSKKRTFVINVARGRHVDTQALITALEQARSEVRPSMSLIPSLYHRAILCGQPRMCSSLLMLAGA
ncbi:2-hydroxyacid dehydrogenase [Ophiostoma piceae UAMH 11346]|uniref:2-hydroxyacid dehydrogenase n=1 Tax=Ophiostoma piceae (strain UAMH 11346) TaxID=1262450 RepID=S3BZC8_OPHP1|nr:2-hydroxyacid dehydrogenase [Ophiostoma piceae UAMH 11346]